MQLRNAKGRSGQQSALDEAHAPSTFQAAKSRVEYRARNIDSGKVGFRTQFSISLHRDDILNSIDTLPQSNAASSHQTRAKESLPLLPTRISTVQWYSSTGKDIQISPGPNITALFAESEVGKSKDWRSKAAKITRN